MNKSLGVFRTVSCPLKTARGAGNTVNHYFDWDPTSDCNGVGELTPLTIVLLEEKSRRGLPVFDWTASNDPVAGFIDSQQG